MSMADDLANLDSTPEHVRQANAARVTLTSEHADVETGPLESPIVGVSDWNGVLQMFGLDPAEFEIVDDTVRMSRWQQSKRLESGQRDLIWLQSYSARFRRVAAVTGLDVESLRERVHRWKPAKQAAPAKRDETPSTFYVGWADWQVGKGDLNRIENAVLDSIEATVSRISELRRLGRNVEKLCIANMGDPLEGCYGNYENQSFTVQATKRQQLNVVLDLWATGLRTLAPLFDSVEFVSVLSNHGEWTRPPGRSTKALTSDSDSADAFLAETLRRILDERNDMRHVRWSIPHDEMTVATDLSGVRVAFAHGHKTPGGVKELEWLRAQSLRLLREHGVEPRLWLTAHRHHVDVRDFGSFTRVQHPTLEVGGITGGSKWYTDQSGLWSTPGTLTMLIGEHEQAGGSLSLGGRGWSDLAIL